MQPYLSFFGRSTAIPESVDNYDMRGRFDTWFAHWAEAFAAYAVDLPDVPSRDAYHRYSGLARLSAAAGQRLVTVEAKTGQVAELNGFQVVQAYHQEAMATLACQGPRSAGG